MPMIYRAHLLNPTSRASLEEIPDAGLAVDAHGRIEDVGPFAAVMQRHPGAQVQDLSPAWILPGLVDLHSHLPQFEAVAMDGLELLPWLEAHIFPAEARFADTEVAARAAQRYFAAMLALGTTTAAVYSTIHAGATDAAFAQAEKAGIRAIIGKVMMDRNASEELEEDTDASLRESEEICLTWHGRDRGRLQYAFTPRFAPTCTPALLKGVGRLAEAHGAFIQTHLSENLQELDWVRELFPEALNYTDVYRRAGMLGPRTLLGHGIHLDSTERAMLRAAGATIVHCPRSNAFLKSGIMPLRRWLDEGLAVGLGTDVGAGPSLSMWSEMAFACTASKLRWASQQDLAARLCRLGVLDAGLRGEITNALDLGPDAPADPALAFRLATLDGARALGMENRIGSLDVGKDADFIVVDSVLVDPAAGHRPPEPAADVLSRLLYRSDPRMVAATFVRGKRCFSREA